MKTCQTSLSVSILLSCCLISHGFHGIVPEKATFVSRATGKHQLARASTRLDVASPLPYTTEPQVNPNADDTQSLSGVSRQAVLSGLDRLYPPQDLQMRNAASRTDGYWAFVAQGQEPPMDLTYGEFDFHFFAQVLDRAHYHYYNGAFDAPSSWNDKIFMDIGSGTGRLVFGAAALHPEWKECRGVELLQGIHNVAVDKLTECTLDSATRVLPTSTYDALPMAPVSLACGSFEDPSISLGDVDCAFAFSSCFTPDLMERLGQAIGRQCKPGTIIITTDYMLPLVNTIPPIEEDGRTGTYRLELAEKVDGWCWLTGGCSTAYAHRFDPVQYDTYGNECSLVVV